jgi:hypothetical protein
MAAVDTPRGSEGKSRGDRAAQRASDDELKAMYLDLAKQWRDMAQQAEELEQLPRNAKS